MATHIAALVRMNRWVILAGYALLTACTQLLWLAYAPITTQTHHAMGVSSARVSVAVCEVAHSPGQHAERHDDTDISHCRSRPPGKASGIQQRSHG